MTPRARLPCASPARGRSASSPRAHPISARAGQGGLRAPTRPAPRFSWAFAPSTPPVGAVGPWRHKERHMVGGRGVGDAEPYWDDVKERHAGRGVVFRGKILGDMERQLVGPRGEL